MIEKQFLELWSVYAPAFGDHLWQSTVFAILIGLGAFTLLRNHARARYWLWLAASLKFLIPFSLLVVLGSHLAWSPAPTGASDRLYITMEQVGRPFSQLTLTTVSSSTSSAAVVELLHRLPAILAVAWACGFFAILCVWYLRWRKISTIVCQAVPLNNGREVETLRRLARVGEGPGTIRILSSRSSLEPGIFGVRQPRLLWPAGISDRLEDSHLDAIIAHELCHVRRRDNLAAAAHMLVEAIFWFHPLVWWLGARLLEDRELACDESVVESGGDRKVYAESILKICEFCVEAPLACVSGVTGANLKKRIVRIMNEARGGKLDFRRKLLLATAGVVSLVLPLAYGLLHPAPGQAETQNQNSSNGLVYETVSINPTQPTETMTRFQFGPDSFTADAMTLQNLIKNIYGVEDAQIAGGPNWLNSAEFDIDARMSPSTLNRLQALPESQRDLVRKQMLQTLLADHFGLALQHQTQVLPVYLLGVAPNGPTLKQATPGDTYADGMKEPDGSPDGPHTMRVAIGEFTVQALPMKAIAQLLTGQMDHIVMDKTGLTGEYDFTLKWAPDETQPPPLRGTGTNQTGPSIFTAIQQQLGLKLELQNMPMQVLVITHAEKPAQK